MENHSEPVPEYDAIVDREQALLSQTPPPSQPLSSYSSISDVPSSPLTELSSTPEVDSPFRKPGAVCSRLLGDDNGSSDSSTNRVFEASPAASLDVSYHDYAPVRPLRKRKAPDLYINAQPVKAKQARRSSPLPHQSVSVPTACSSCPPSPVQSRCAQTLRSYNGNTPPKPRKARRDGDEDAAQGNTPQKPRKGDKNQVVRLTISKDRLQRLTLTWSESSTIKPEASSYYPSVAYTAPYFAATSPTLTAEPETSPPTVVVPEDADSYAKLLHISQAIMVKTPLDQKPEPIGNPEVWADSRQALCESILYYQAWQGACYMSKGVVYSFMFDNNGHIRDLIDSDVIVARAGGCMTRDKYTHEMVQFKDQKDNGQSQAVRAAIAHQNPIAIFCGMQNADAPSRMPHRYCSLGWFKATHAWSDKTWTQNEEARENIKYRFEKLDSHEASWWSPKGLQLPAAIGAYDPPVELGCLYCHATHQQVYLEGWMCLNPGCDMFWRLWNGHIPRDHELNYDPRFLKQRTIWKSEEAPYDLRPQLPNPSARMGDDVTYAMTRGICCPRCGKCTSRYLFKGWICSNLACDFTHFPTHVTITANSIRDPWHPVSAGISQSHDYADAEHVSTSFSFSHNYRILTYRIAGIDGHITHLVANKTVNEEPRGPDEMFEALQTLDAGLERRRFTTGKEEFMTAFSANFGMPYKFVASVDSQPFSSAPWPVTETRSRLNWAAERVVGPLFKASTEEEAGGGGFNELLAIAYFDGQNIKYHDDGEKGLGETVASLSLGQPADMWFRIKAKHWCGVSKAGVFTDARPLPGTADLEARKVAWEKLQEDDHRTDTGGKQKKLVALGKELGLSNNVKDRKPWLRLRLSHGDVIVMHGSQIQEYLEHQVDPLGKLRFALTCRTILKGHLSVEEMPHYQVEADDCHYDGSGIVETRT